MAIRQFMLGTLSSWHHVVGVVASTWRSSAEAQGKKTSDAPVKARALAIESARSPQLEIELNHDYKSVT